MSYTSTTICVCMRGCMHASVCAHIMLEYREYVCECCVKYAIVFVYECMCIRPSVYPVMFVYTNFLNDLIGRWLLPLLV